MWNDIKEFIANNIKPKKSFLSKVVTGSAVFLGSVAVVDAGIVGYHYCWKGISIKDAWKSKTISGYIIEKCKK